MTYEELYSTRHHLKHERVMLRAALFTIRYKQLQQQLKHYPEPIQAQEYYPESWLGEYACGLLCVRRHYITLRGGLK